MFVTNADGSAVRGVAGDTVAVPRGWTGRYDVASAVKAVTVCAKISQWSRRWR